jgi:hypothetical protein
MQKVKKKSSASPKLLMASNFVFVSSAVCAELHL